jgi:hypothetical protein
MPTDDYPLFGEWLMRTAILQRMSYKKNPAELEGDERAEYFRTMVAALVFELGEMSNEIGWKTWGSDRTIHRENYIKEAVDVMHFIGNLLVLAGCTDSELNAAYNAKMKVNEERMLRDSYNGRTEGKCALCKRSFDDVGQWHDTHFCSLCGKPAYGEIK